MDGCAYNAPRVAPLAITDELLNLPLRLEMSCTVLPNSIQIMALQQRLTLLGCPLCMDDDQILGTIRGDA